MHDYDPAPVRRTRPLSWVPPLMRRIRNWSSRILVAPDEVPDPRDAARPARPSGPDVNDRMPAGDEPDRRPGELDREPSREQHPRRADAQATASVDDRMPPAVTHQPYRPDSYNRPDGYRPHSDPPRQLPAIAQGAPAQPWARREDGVLGLARNQVPRQRVAGTPPLLDPAKAVPPRFGQGSLAGARPWLLPDMPSAPPGIAADQCVLGDLVLRGASVVGAGHRCERPAKPRQDAYRVAQDQAGQHLIIAVADGMSDSARAELGAQVATGQAIAHVRRLLDSGVRATDLPARRIFEEVANSMIASAEERGLTAADVRTTLTVAVAPAQPDADGSRWLWAGYVADTGIWGRGKSSWKRVVGPDKVDFDGNALAQFLPHHPDTVVQKVLRVPPRAVFAVLTDGISDALTEVEGASAWLHERWADPPPLASFILDIDFDAPGQLDDRTSVVVWTGMSESGLR